VRENLVSRLRQRCGARSTRGARYADIEPRPLRTWYLDSRVGKALLVRDDGGNGVVLGGYGCKALCSGYWRLYCDNVSGTSRLDRVTIVVQIQSAPRSWERTAEKNSQQRGDSTRSLTAVSRRRLDLSLSLFENSRLRAKCAPCARDASGRRNPGRRGTRKTESTLPQAQPAWTRGRRFSSALPSLPSFPFRAQHSHPFSSPSFRSRDPVLGSSLCCFLPSCVPLRDLASASSVYGGRVCAGPRVDERFCSHFSGHSLRIRYLPVAKPPSVGAAPPAAAGLAWVGPGWVLRRPLPETRTLRACLLDNDRSGSEPLARRGRLGFRAGGVPPFPVGGFPLVYTTNVKPYLLGLLGWLAFRLQGARLARFKMARMGGRRVHLALAVEGRGGVSVT
jgi:hypothetical protein